MSEFVLNRSKGCFCKSVIDFILHNRNLSAIEQFGVFILQDECTVVPQSFSYSVKVINPAKKTDYSLRKFRVSVRFATVDDVKSLAESFPTFITKEGELEFGYIAPGNGARGQQRWISDDI